MVRPQAALLVLLSSIAFSVQAANPACQQKAASIQQQIAQAKEHGNTHRQRGLERALANVEAHCTDAGLIRDMKADIAEQREEVNEVQTALQQKHALGRTDKINKLERKLARERAELQTLEDELRDLERVAAP